MTRQDAEILIEKYTEGKATPEERKLVEYYFNQHLANSDASPDLAQLQKDNKEVWNNLAGYIGETKSSKYKLWPRIAVAAAAVAAITLGTWIYMNDFASSRKAPRNDEVVVNDIAPGRNGATITLANGKVIQLSDAKSGVVIGEDLKYSDGEILRDALDDKGGVLSSRVSRDLVASTTKGQTYEFTLPDGTKVWLNADSKIEFASNLATADVRLVKLTGEGYFEVAKNKRRFTVHSKDQEVTVLGTHFNINSYADEGAVKTTLLEGSVSVRHADPEGTSKQTISASRNRKTTLQGRDPDLRQDDLVLKPNQQSIVKNNTIQVSPANIEEAIDWKNGEFVANNESLGSIMRKISRWYNVDVVYSSEDLKNRTFDGSLSRYDNVQRILNTIEFAGTVKFKLNGRTITVLNNK